MRAVARWGRRASEEGARRVPLCCRSASCMLTFFNFCCSQWMSSLSKLALLLRSLARHRALRGVVERRSCTLM